MSGLIDTQIRAHRENVESSLFNDSASQTFYEDNVKKRLTTKYSKDDMRMNDAPTAGVSLRGHFGHDLTDDIIIAPNANAANSMLSAYMNDDAYSVTSQGTPNFLTTIWTNKMFEVVNRATVFEKVSHSFQQGTFGATDIKIPTLSFDGNYSLYADQGAQGNAGINTNWVDRQVVDFERTLVYGDKAIAQMAMGKIDYVGKLREGVLRQIKLHADAVGFFGYSANMRIYGLMNDPSLRATISAATGAGGSTLFSGKTAFEIQSDIIAIRQAVTNVAGGQDDDDTKCYLLLPPSAWQYLNTSFPIGGFTVLDWLNRQYPSMELIKAPLLQGTGTPIGSVAPSYAVLIFDNLQGQECLLNAFVTLYNSHGVVRQTSSFEEKISYSLAGGVVSNAIGVQIMRGI